MKMRKNMTTSYKNVSIVANCKEKGNKMETIGKCLNQKLFKCVFFSKRKTVTVRQNKFDCMWYFLLSYMLFEQSI